MYLIQQSDLFGLTRTDMLLVALVARYHRGASPKPSHLGYVKLDRDQRIAVTKLAALLRVATALDSSRSGRISEFNCQKSSGKLVITIPGAEDLSVEQLALNRNGLLFQQIFGRSVLLRGSSLQESSH
jgi:exopolyphosphatase/guanosine-5'-triphosphate,3'-diphosphate pyrophosphatase